MCGIAGLIGRPDEAALQRMLFATTHRGPDDSGVFADELVSFGMNRLSIIDLSSAGHQPMFSPDGRYVIVFNGEMYNFQEQRAFLQTQGFKFRSHADTEVVLMLFIYYGKKCVDHMRGMFAFAIWDKNEKELFVARDHMGVKPFIYTEQGGALLFASELKGLMASGHVAKDLDTGALAEYFVTGHITQPKTIFKNVKFLLPGHILVWKNNTVKIEKYWDYPHSREGEVPSYSEAVSTVRELVLQSVKEELISDVPVGVFLSGGLDSSIVVAAMRKAGASHIESFSVGFGGEGDSIDETSDAEDSSKFYGTSHNKILISGKEVARDFEKMVCALDMPVHDGYNTYFVSKYSRHKVKVALSGLGGDELFGGYGYHRSLLNRTPAQELLKWFPKGLLQFAPGQRARMAAENMIATRSLPTHYATLNRVFNPFVISPLLVDSLKHDGRYYADLIDGYNEAMDDPTLPDPFQRISRINMKSFMTSRLLRDSDAVSMYSSLELRVPIINKRIVEYAYLLPWQYKFGDLGQKSGHNLLSYKDFSVKRLLTDAFHEDLPTGFMDRKKRGFFMPVKLWLINYFGDRIDHVLRDNNNPFLDRKGLLALHKTWRTSRSNYNQIWSILIFDEWCKQFKLY